MPSVSTISGIWASSGRRIRRKEEARREYERIWSQLGSRTIEELIDLPLMSDPASLATLDVLTKIAAPAYYTDANLLALVACRAVNLSLERGNCDASCFAYVWLGMVAGPRFGDYEAAYRFGRLGYDLVERRGLTRFQARTYIEFGRMTSCPWTRHVRAGRDLLRRAFEAANRIGDLTFAAYCCRQSEHEPSRGGRSARRGATRSRAWPRVRAEERGSDLPSTSSAPQLGLIRTLRGLTPTFGSL